MSQNICNICGANYEYIAGRWKCPACGAYKAEELSNEEVTLLYNANQKLRLSDFDEAEKSFSDIIEKYPQNPNGYWGRLLAKYGIKYEDDFDGRKIPTCYATSIESVMSDKDYKKAIELADADTKAYYQKQVEYIERVRKEWVEKARKEKPYDIFLCYKDSDLANGIDRTKDSVAVQELYIHLTKQGYRVFFSRESLRDKVGEKYEPYIFNALSTAKVMLVYGSKPEYITSTWLKNEWTRYEKRLRAGEKKPNSLLVACDGFSPNELPKALSSMQCFDATKPSFYSDLDAVVKKIVGDEVKKKPITNNRTEKKKVNIKKAVIGLIVGIALIFCSMLSLYFLGNNSSSTNSGDNNNNIAQKSTINFNANGGSGTMADQSITVGVPCSLNKCKFTRNGYTFEGWAMSAGGTIVYTDGASITINTENAVSLYAVWVPLHQHDYKIIGTVPASCTADGNETYKCTGCQDTYSETIPKLTHEYELIATTSASCIADGSKTYKCSGCQDTYSETILKLTHEYKIVASQEPTCQNEGYTTYKCSLCSDEYTEAKGETSHDVVLSSTIDSTCTTVGQKNYTCKNCTHTYSEEIAKKSHNYIEATCTAPKTCSTCNETEGAALGHSNTVICTRCGHNNFETITLTGTGDYIYKNLSLPAGKYKITVDFQYSDRLSIEIFDGSTTKEIYHKYQSTVGVYKVITYEATSEITDGHIFISSGSSGTRTWTITIEAVGN